ncbi:NAD(P)-dependent oxidoreductase [Tahibacter amnicola]|uniref:NAD(P)-dependent oxidoreductase n=1 Tax=Tahibacter amnicola TaxID=2976241 RepID=A0ABY6BH94_9GAMM|nr:NAD(P)-dependent oxidoreductase [Tahibacter amnicola]UXI68450.1 NAD(P)-dependent oxidoreductase [Tahibacter amnicola]
MSRRRRCRLVSHLGRITMNSKDQLHTGFIGLGAMGWPMAAHLKQAGLLVAVANRSPEKARRFADEHGVTAHTSYQELARQCRVVVLCVSADSDVIAVTRDIASACAPGTVVIDHSTVSSQTAREAAAILRAAGADFIDAPVSGGVEGARNGKLSIMAGGEAATLQRVMPVLEAYGLRITHMGEVGAGQNTKAVNQVLVAGIAQAVTEGLALGEALGLDPASLLPTLAAGAAGNWFLDKRGATMLRNEFSVGFKLGLLHKDLQIVRGLAEAAGTDRGIIEKSLADYARLMEQGHADDDISALIRLKRPRV